jgi:glutamate synthase (ferredoxin)
MQNRSKCPILPAGAVARLHGDRGFAGRLRLRLRGSAGQSFGCFLVTGIEVSLVGEANDYVGKGMAGGEITIVPPPGSSFKVRKQIDRILTPGTEAHGCVHPCAWPADCFLGHAQAEEASLVGNTCLYGATGGRLFVNGRAGERFAVRNSNAEAVVEGTGDHCCEYMTGGVVVSLGSVGARRPGFASALEIQQASRLPLQFAIRWGNPAAAPGLRVAL